MTESADYKVEACFGFPESEKTGSTTDLYLIRHGATEANIQRPSWLQGCGTDLPLSPLGRKQASALTYALRFVTFDRILSSPLARAQETASYIAEQQKIDIESYTALKEVDVGSWEGKDWETIADKDPVAYQQFISDPAIYGYPDGETFTQVLQRCKTTIEESIHSLMGQSVAVVAHNVVNRCYLADILKIPLAHARKIRQDNGCVNLIRIRDGQRQLITLNAVPATPV